MSEETEELARRAVACEGWRWMAGMVGIRNSGTEFDGDRHRVTIKTRSTMDNIGWLPDLSDPATRGCLLELVREVRDEPRAYVEHGSRGCRVMSPFASILGDAMSAFHDHPEPAALVAALEAADE